MYFPAGGHDDSQTQLHEAARHADGTRTGWESFLAHLRPVLYAIFTSWG